MDASLDISRALKTSIRGLPIEWKRPPGRPRHTKLRTLKADLQPHNLGLNSAWKYAQDREQWKHLVETANAPARGMRLMMMISYAAQVYLFYGLLQILQGLHCKSPAPIALFVFYNVLCNVNS